MKICLVETFDKGFSTLTGFDTIRIELLVDLGEQNEQPQEMYWNHRHHRQCCHDRHWLSAHFFKLLHRHHLHLGCCAVHWHCSNSYTQKTTSSSPSTSNKHDHALTCSCGCCLCSCCHCGGRLCHTRCAHDTCCCQIGLWCCRADALDKCTSRVMFSFILQHEKTHSSGDCANCGWCGGACSCAGQLRIPDVESPEGGIKQWIWLGICIFRWHSCICDQERNEMRTHGKSRGHSIHLHNQRILSSFIIVRR